SNALSLFSQVRQVSTSLTRQVSGHGNLFMPPIQVYGVEGRYAYALFSAASQQGRPEQVEKELMTVFALVKDPKLSGIMVNPHVKRSIKEHTFTDVMTIIIIINVLNVMADNDRLTLTSDIISAFSKMMSAHRGEVLCTVTTTQPLDAAILKDLRVALNGFLLVCTCCYMSECLFCSLSAQSDPSILGGMTVSIRDKYVDMSTETNIHKLTKISRET
uniref:Oligomycin sensitivity conferral protein n=1 Tax=Oncorhynchus mykiss TaxID=8022 RepID=A0A8C7T814_ONCMY